MCVGGFVGMGVMGCGKLELEVFALRRLRLGEYEFGVLFFLFNFT